MSTMHRELYETLMISGMPTGKSRSNADHQVSPYEQTHSNL